MQDMVIEGVEERDLPPLSVDIIYYFLECSIIVTDYQKQVEGAANCCQLATLSL